ncbi:hypothetical protein [Promicromonospora sp. NFX87]|uniref:hypothetical protein n=1 Tax=Promicromonospora sp. NFX87 TaxID=3402691 RepID=UPI003AFB22D6
MSAEPTSRKIPAEVKRAVRQRCGFGCVACGMPLFEYEHMLEFATVQRHVAEEITLLCPDHHAEKTRGGITADLVREWNASPFNLRTEMSKPRPLYFHGNSCIFTLGSISIRNEMEESHPHFQAITVDGKELLGFEFDGGRPLLNLSLYDHQDQPLVQVENSELMYRTDQWDVEWVGQTLTVRRAQRQPTIEIDFVVPDQVVIRRAQFRYRGIEFCVEPTFAVITNTGGLIVNSYIKQAWTAIAIGHDSESAGPGGFRFTDVPRHVPSAVRAQHLQEARATAALFSA